MIIVSNTKVKSRSNYPHMSYEEFETKAFSDEGLDTNGEALYINIHDVNKEIYPDLKEAEGIYFFSLKGTCPNWADADRIENWKLLEDSYNISDTISADNLKGDSNSIPADALGVLDGSQGDDNNGSAKIYVFGSSKGGTGKTFTSIISTYRYAKTHPSQRIALVDFDIIDGQVGISIHKKNPTLRKYYTEYQKGYRDFATMKNFSVRGNNFPDNVDFYLAPSQSTRINDNGFWINVIENCVNNYDVVVFDTGIDYINLKPISYVYKAADKILLITTTSIKSVNSVTKQIGRLSGTIPSKDATGNNVFSPEDGIADRLNIVITQMVPTSDMSRTIYTTLAEKAKVVATFGVITDPITRAEFYGEWNVFDRNAGVNKALDDIMSI